MIRHGVLPFGMYDSLKHTFNQLPEDQYAKPGYRYRRFSQYKMFMGKPELVETDHFMQSSELNSEFGDIERKFEPMDPALLKDDNFNYLFKIFHHETGVSTIDCHQVRILIGPDGAPAAPEGRHQDGYDYIMATIVTKENVTGGDFMVWETKTGKKHIFKEGLVNEYGIIDDRKYFHTGEDLKVIDEAKPGRWEWFVLGGYR